MMKDAGKKFRAVTYDGAGPRLMRTGEEPQGSEANRQGARRRMGALEGPVEGDLSSNGRLASDRLAGSPRHGEKENVETDQPDRVRPLWPPPHSGRGHRIVRARPRGAARHTGELSATYGSIADVIIAAKRSRPAIVRGFSDSSYGHAQGRIAAAKAA